MAVTRVKKQKIYTFLESEVVPQTTVVFLTTLGATKTLDAESDVNFRKSARKAGVVIKVVKNTISRKLFPELPKSTGQTYMAFLEDAQAKASEVTVPKATIKIIDQDYKEMFKVFGAVVNGKYYDAQETEKLSKVPSLEESMSMIAGSINSVISKVPSVIQEISAKLARSVNELKKQKS